MSQAERSPYDQHWIDWKKRFASQHASRTGELSSEGDVEIIRTSVKRSTDTIPPEPSTPKKKST